VTRRRIERRMCERTTHRSSTEYPTRRR
jgi:hypothetical protein